MVLNPIETFQDMKLKLRNKKLDQITQMKNQTLPDVGQGLVQRAATAANYNKRGELAKDQLSLKG